MKLAAEDNKVRPEDRSVHDWYRFVLSFPPHLVRNYLEKFGADRTSRVLDPFCGTGTTLVECKKLGIASVGIEANPIASFASRVKVDWSAEPHALLRHARNVARLAVDRLNAQGVADEPELPLFSSGSKSDRNLRRIAGLRTFPMEARELLLRNSISALPLHKTLVLLEAITELSHPGFEPYERLALARSVVSGISNLQFGPEVGVGPPKEDAPVVAAWLRNVRDMADDLDAVRENDNAEAAVYLADARQPLSVLESSSIDIVITSPPYPNEKDYTRTTRLESVLLGFIRSKRDLRALKQRLVRSNTRGVYKTDSDDLLVADHPEIQRIAQAIENRRIALRKTSGFERLYPRVTRLYFGGMARHLAELRRALRPGAYLAYVVGDQASYLRVMIRTGQLLADLAGALGYDIIEIDLFRTRLATATKAALREEVVVLRWPG